MWVARPSVSGGGSGLSFGTPFLFLCASGKDGRRCGFLGFVLSVTWRVISLHVCHVCCLL